MGTERSLIVAPSIYQKCRTSIRIRALQENVATARKKITDNLIVIDENIEFHQLLAKASKNNLFMIVVEAITTAVRHCMSQLGAGRRITDTDARASERIMQSRNTLTFHAEIIEAMLEKNTEKATDILEAHLLEVKNRLMLLMDLFVHRETFPQYPGAGRSGGTLPGHGSV